MSVHGINVNTPAAPIFSLILPPQLFDIIEALAINCNTITNNKYIAKYM